MATATNHDIIDYVIRPALGDEFDAETFDRIVAAIFEVAPVSTWTLVDLEYVSDAMTTDEFWAIVEREGTK